MRPLRLLLTLLLSSVALAGTFAPSPASARAADGWTLAGEQPTAETARVAVTLADGSVLLTGGSGEGGGEFAGAARFDPATGSWSRTADMLTARDAHTATLLADGRVLVAGGYGSGASTGADGFVNTAALYNPATDTWAATGDLVADRARHFATRLPDGRVLVGGGYNGNAYTGDAVVPLASAEVYDPATGRWSPAPTMRGGHGDRTATTLPDGTVLVTGGDGDCIGTAVASAEVYDPATNRWRDTSPPSAARARGAAVALADGSVLLAGGYSGVNDGGASFRPLAAAERYVPEGNRWVAAGAMPVALVAPVATPLPDGGALVVGVQVIDAGRSVVALVAARYDGLAGTWSPVDPLPGFSATRTATALPDGRVLVTGNYRDPRSTVQGPPGAAVTALYDGGVPARICFTATGQCVAGLFQAYWLRHGALAINGLPLSGAFRQTLEDGREYTVQYFEQARLEYHPEHDPPHHVLLGQFGRRLHPADPPVPPVPDATSVDVKRYFPETGHTVSFAFLAYWQANGGLMQFGYPLSEEFTETLEDGLVYRVQYFERARFEYHPEIADPQYQVRLGQFGRRILAEGVR